MKKRVFSLLAAVMVLVCICSVPASAEEVYYDFEIMPPFGSLSADQYDFNSGDGFGILESDLPEGTYEVTGYIYDGDVLVSEFVADRTIVVVYNDVNYERYAEANVGFTVFGTYVSYILRIVPIFGYTYVGLFFDSGSRVDVPDGMVLRFVPVSSGGIIENLGSVFSAAQRTMQIEFVIYGFTLTWWDVFLWSTIATVVGYLIVRFLHG